MLLREVEGEHAKFAGMQTLDKQGRLRTELSTKGLYSINVWGPGRDGLPSAELESFVRVEDGSNEWQLDLQCAVISGSLDAGLDRDNLQLRAELAGGGSWRVALHVAQDRTWRAWSPLGALQFVRVSAEDPIGEPLEHLGEHVLGRAGLTGVRLAKK